MSFRYKAIIVISCLLSIINIIALIKQKKSEEDLLPNVLNEQNEFTCKSDGFYYVNINRLISQHYNYNLRSIVVDGFFYFDEIEGIAKIGIKANSISDLGIGEAIALNFKNDDIADESYNEVNKSISNEKHKFYKFLNGKHVRIKGVYKYYSCSIQEASQFIEIGIIKNAELMSIVGRGKLK